MIHDVMMHIEKGLRQVLAFVMGEHTHDPLRHGLDMG